MYQVQWYKSQLHSILHLIYMTIPEIGSRTMDYIAFAFFQLWVGEDFMIFHPRFVGYDVCDND